MATTQVSFSQVSGLRRSRLASLGTMNALSHSRLALLALAAVLLLGAACLFYLNLAASVNASSTRLHQLTQERRLLEWRRAEKARELTQLSHLDRLETRAQELGFRPPRSVTYVTVSPEVASSLDLKNRQAPTPKTEDKPQPTGWDAIRAQFERWLSLP